MDSSKNSLCSARFEQQGSMDKQGDATETSLCGEEELRVPRLECAICLQKCIHPARLPCGHIFCYLCVKGIANQSKRCAMCRQEIPADFVEKPELVLDPECEHDAPPTEESYRWFYEGRNGWWQYDERTSAELEAASAKGEPRCEVLIAGFLYIVDFELMVQFRRNDFSRRRRVKRDLASVPKKGIAGIRLEEPAQDPGSNVAARECGVSSRTRRQASRSGSSSSDDGSGNTQVSSSQRPGEPTVEPASTFLDSPNGAGDASELLSDEEASTAAILEGDSFRALSLEDSGEMGSGDSFASTPIRHGRRRYYEDNL
ncbi:E3 ubiquitin-protein ligase rnf146-like [Haemaphysalis longicornis]